MASKDARKLSAEAQETLRLRVIEAIRGGMKPAVAARTFGVSRTAVFYWRRAHERDPAAAKRSKEREYPAIAQQAKAENAGIHWGDQLGARSDHQAGKGCGRIIKP